MSIYIEKRITSSGSKRYRAQVRLIHYPRKTKTFPTKREAEIWAKNIEHEMRHSSPADYACYSVKSLSDLIQWHLQYEMPKKAANTQYTQRSQLQRWNALLGHLPIHDITTKQLIKVRTELQAGISPLLYNKISDATINRYFAALSSVFTSGARANLITSNPLANMDWLKEPKGKTRYLSELEVQALIRACEQSKNKTVALVTLIALRTGMRKGEILGLRWENINLERKQIHLQRTKNNHQRYVPLTDTLVVAISDWKAENNQPNDLLFPASRIKNSVTSNKPMDIKKGFKNILQSAGITDFRFHDLRHTAASYLAMSGAQTLDIANILGHRTLAMTQRYAHLSAHHSQQVLENAETRMLNNFQLE